MLEYLESLRENGQININSGLEEGTITIDETENKGARNKFWCNNYEFLCKEIFDGSCEDFAELIAYEIAQELNVECAEYDLASYNGKRCVITKNFVNDDAGEELISGTEIIQEVYQKHILPLQKTANKYFELLNEFGIDEKLSNIDNIDITTKRNCLEKIKELFQNNFPNYNYPITNIEVLNKNDIKNEFLETNDIFTDIRDIYSLNFAEWTNGIVKSNNLFDLWSVFDNYCKLNGFAIENSNKLINDLLNLFIYDIITSQGDRHSDNWGIVVNRDQQTIRFSPIYDNSNMCNLNRSKAIDAINQYIIALKEKRTNASKYQRIEDKLKKSIFHARSSLKVDPRNVDEKSNNLIMMEDFAIVTSKEDTDIITKQIDKLTPDKIEEIFYRIEQKTKCFIPQKIKNVVAKTIAVNIEELKNAIDKKEVKGNAK